MRPHKTYHTSLLTPHSTEEWCLGDRALGEGMFPHSAIISHNPPVISDSVCSCESNIILLVDVKLQKTRHSFICRGILRLAQCAGVLKTKTYMLIISVCMMMFVQSFRLLRPLRRWIQTYVDRYCKILTSQISSGASSRHPSSNVSQTIMLLSCTESSPPKTILPKLISPACPCGRH